MAARFGLGSLLGAGAAGAYGYDKVRELGYGDFLRGMNRVMVGDIPTSSGKPAPSGEVTALHDEVDRLTKLVSDVLKNQRNGPQTIVLGGQRGWSVLIIPTLGGVAVLYMYCRLTGSSIWDMLYVSRSSLSQFRTTVTESFNKMWDEMRKQKEEFVNRISTLVRKQDELKDSQNIMLDKQGEMDQRLRRVDDTVDNIQAKANQIGNHVESLDNKVADVFSGVQMANNGIYLLCHSVAEVTQRIGMNNTRSTQALKSFLSTGPVATGQGVVTAGPQVPALPGTAAAPGSGSSSFGNGLRMLVDVGGGDPAAGVSHSLAQLESSSSIHLPPGGSGSSMGAGASRLSSVDSAPPAVLATIYAGAAAAAAVGGDVTVEPAAPAAAPAASNSGRGLVSWLSGSKGAASTGSSSTSSSKVMGFGGLMQ